MSTTVEAQYPTPAWATEWHVSWDGIVDWYATVASFPGVALITADDVTVQVHHSSPNDDNAVDPNPHVSVTVGLETADFYPAAARRIADALNRAAEIAEGGRNR